MWSTDRASRRAQANLVSLIAALFAISAVTVLGVTVADSELAGQDRQAAQRHAATALSERLIEAASPLTARRNVVDSSAIGSLTATQLRSRYPTLDGRAFEVRLDDRVLASDGSTRGGTTIRRLVLVEQAQSWTTQPSFGAGNQVTLPRRTTRFRLELTPDNASVSAVRANERTVLRDPNGLRGTYTLSLPRRETVQLVFRANTTLSQGDATVTLFPRQTRKARLAVTVDG